MKKDVIKFLVLFAFVLLLTIATATCAFSGKAKAVTCTKTASIRVSAPVDTYEDDVNVRRAVPERGRTVEDAGPYKEVEIASVSAAAPVTEAVDVYELVDSTPLRTEVQMMIEDVCAARDVDVRVVLALIEVESGFDERAVGDSCQSYGLMQVRPDSHSDRMARLGVQNLLDGVQNVLVGVDFLDELLDRYGGDYYKAVTAYNKGHFPGYVTPYAYKVMEVARLCQE